jgi:hypothetical protein
MNVYSHRPVGMNGGYQPVGANGKPIADPIRNEPCVRLKVQCRTTTTLPTTHPSVQGRLPEGEHVVEVYASDLDAINARVETDWDMWKQAQQVHARKRQEHIKRQWRGHIPEDESLWDQTLRLIAYRYGGSPEAEFFAVVNRGVKPLTKVEVLEETPSPVASPASDEDPEIREMRAEMREMRSEMRKAREENERLQKQLDQKRR